jgi:type III secretion protein C
MNHWIKTHLLILFSLLSSSLFSQEEATAEVSFTMAPVRSKTTSTDGYTINYDTISIIEYIRFASKICNVNFIFNEADLGFTVTVVSDAPVTPQNVMATLVQLLRIHGLTLLEQENNLVVHKGTDVVQIATLVTENGQGKNAPIVTRIFRVKNIKPDAIAAIIRPMISSSSLLEVSTETRQLILTDVTANVEKVASLIEILDSPHTPLDIKTYEVQQNTPQYLIELCSQIMTPMAQGNPFILVPQLLANQIFIVSTPDLVDKTLALLKTLDTPPKKELLPQKKLGTDNMFVYKAENRPSDELLGSLLNISSNLKKTGIPEGDLIESIETAKPIKETNSIMFVGSKESIGKLKEFLAALDVPPKGGMDKSSFFVYRPYTKSVKEIQTSLQEMANNLKGTRGANESLIETIQSAKINHGTNTIVFSGEEKNFVQIKELLATIDEPIKGALPSTRSNFFVYKIQSASFHDLDASLKNFAEHLDKSNVSDEGLIQSIDQMKYIKETNSILFTGPDASLKRLQELVPSFDTGISTLPSSNQFFIYKPRYQKGEQLAESLREVTHNFTQDKLADPALLRTLQSMKFVKSNNSFLFTGDAASIKKLEGLIATVDVAGKTDTDKKYYIYKVQHTTGDLIEEDLDKLAKNFKSSGLKNQNVLSVIDNIRYVKETNSLLLTGDGAAIEEVKTIIAGYDYPRAVEEPASSNFFMYKPQHAPAPQIQLSLKDVGESLKNANLADPSLLKAISSAKYVESTNSLIFTGTPDALQKIQTLIKDIDVPPQTHAAIQHVGKTTFLLYKLKNAGSTQIITSIKSMTADLKKSGHGDKDFLSALNSMKYIPETNSLLFTGQEEALNRVQDLISQFDVASLSGKDKDVKPVVTGQPNFFLYKPQSLTGPSLQQILNDFADNLKLSGLSDPDLFNSINSMRWVETTHSLVFTGTAKALDQVKELLHAFDVPGNLTGDEAPTSGDSSIQSIDNTSFLVYKLQFHKGDEIQGALRQIAKDLILSNASVNQSLLNSINSIQWLEVTNSLLCSGDQETLPRLKELIKNLDIPLKQVFIEMLVIETTLTNALNFGLEWGANYKYRNSFAASMFNTPADSPGAPVSSNQTTFTNYLSQLNPGATPAQTPSPVTNAAGTTGIPPGTGFDLGVIGEIIKHNGQTFLTLGSLLTAIQTDTESSVIMTPKIITQDGKTSSIFVGTNTPFAGSFVNNVSTGATIQTTNVEYRDIGLNLTITPVLGNSDIVTLDINLDRSFRIATPAGDAIATSNSTTIGGITTSRTTMQTTVHVPDKNFLILSGFVNNSNVKSKTGIPCLGGLPLIGSAFSKDNDTIANNNIVIFLRPRIITSLDEMRRMTSDQESFFRDQSSTPFLEHNYDEAIESIKTVDDE